MKEITRVAVTLANLAEVLPSIRHAMSSVSLIGLDIETCQPRAHPGVVAMNKGKKVVFDIKRTDITGLSLWCNDYEEAWYFNLFHADVEGRIPWHIMVSILNLKSEQAKWVIHNANFERTMFLACQGWVVRDFICTYQMAVSAFGPDEYNVQEFIEQDLGGIAILIPEIQRVSQGMQDTNAVMEVLAKVIGKESDAEHSYNGWVKGFSYAYGLKQLVAKFFGYQMKTFKETLGVHAHMGELTTAETSFYGCDDAIWCVRLYHRLLQFMLETNPAVVGTYFQQELPMIPIYSDVWATGVKINVPAVRAKELDLRVQYAEKTKRLKALVRSLLPFPTELHKGLVEHEKWYAKNGHRYRQKLIAWANSPDFDDDFEQCTQLSGSIPNAWAADLGVALPDRLNITYYMCMRVIMYDLFRRPKLIVVKGKVQSDAWARGRLKEALGHGPAADVLTVLGEMATIEQSSKLYITPYLKLVDPETGKLHPQLGSELATRRCAMQNPNAQQLAKRGESVYVRGFFLADYGDHVIVSIDWSQIELVLIGEESGDPFFKQCYSSLPYSDLHVIAVADCLEVPQAELLRAKRGDTSVSQTILLNTKGEVMEPEKAFKWWRTELGKGANFSYWYSGALSQVGERLGWSTETMWEMTGKYRSKFSVGEEWRISEIHFGQANGYVNLRDGHRRVRFEATPSWASLFRAKWRRYETPEVMWFAEKVIRRLQSRSNNQLINAKIQGTCATLAKRSIPVIVENYPDPRVARFMFMVHDELVFSVHRDHVTPFIQLASKVMCDHPEIISNLVMDCSPAVGLTFEPWHKSKARTGQIELREAPPIDCVPTHLVNKELPPELWPAVVDWLFTNNQQ